MSYSRVSEMAGQKWSVEIHILSVQPEALDGRSDNIPVLLRLTSVIEVDTRALQSLISCWDCKDCTLEGCQRATGLTSGFWGSSFVFMLPFCFITPWEFILLGANFVVEGTCPTNC